MRPETYEAIRRAQPGEFISLTLREMAEMIRDGRGLTRRSAVAVITITEALAELKTIDKRLTKKREFVMPYLWRQDGLKDPLEKDGGSVEVIKRERQSIADLEARIVALRTGIQRINQSTSITIEDVTKTIAEWLTWRKEVAPGVGAFIGKMRQAIQQTRQAATSRGVKVLSSAEPASTLLDINVNVDESELAKEAEKVEIILGTLDGQLSLKNATTTIDV